MKIRTRLLLFLLPVMIIETFLITSTLGYKWNVEMQQSYKTKLKSALVTYTTLIDFDDLLQNKNASSNLKANFPTKLLLDDFIRIKNDLNLSNLYVLPLSNDSSFSFMDAKNLLSSNIIYIDNLESEKPQIKDFLLKNSFFLEDVYLTPVYKSQDQKIITAYFPIKNQNQKTIAFIAADMSMNLIDKKLKEGLFLIVLTAGIIITLMIISLVIIANKISQPVQTLNNSALTLAAGKYTEKIEIAGPKEIVELSNTLNIMSECLYENIKRLKENSILRERMYGEYECSMLLQNHMLKKVLDENRSDAIAINDINIYSHSPRGFMLDLPSTETEEFLQIRLIEAKEKGFDGMYKLLTNYKNFKQSQSKLTKKLPMLDIVINKKKYKMEIFNNKLSKPIVFSAKRMEFLEYNENELTLDPATFIFIFNKGLYKIFKNENEIKDLLFKILKFFSEDGLETITDMLKKELTFATKRKDIEDDIHLLCLQLLF